MEDAAPPAPPPPRSRAYVRDLFLRLLGIIFMVAFLSLLVQVTVLYGRFGLLPAAEYLHALRDNVSFLRAPTIFWLGASDTALRLGAAAGVLLSLGLVLNLAPRYCLIALWALYLSFATIGQSFLSFQWDNLLLEAALFSLFLTPGGLRPKNASSPHPIAVFLMLWLLFRVFFESGLAKLLSGDPTWRNLTAMATYYETAPLPTWVGWYAQQLPLWVQKATSLLTLLIEIVVVLFLWGPRRLRVFVFAILIAMQVAIALTANYGFFNYLTMALCLFILDDGHLARLAARFGRRLVPRPAGSRSALRTGTLAAVAILAVPLSTVPFLPFFRSMSPIYRRLVPIERVLDTYRSLNAYHLFAQMTLTRREAVIEGSDDGATWKIYEFRYKPGDPDRAPPFVAPHQPRVDFQMWFLLLGGPPRAPYFHTLLSRLFTIPRAVAPLFSRDPFPDEPPAFLRIVVYRYQFTDFATRRTTGAWWKRTRIGESAVLRREDLER